MDEFRTYVMGDGIAPEKRGVSWDLSKFVYRALI